MWGNYFSLTHQQFVDDIMMFGQETLKEARTLMEILNDFLSTSGTEINKDKLDIFFFNTTTRPQNFLARILGYCIGNLPSKYLGIPLNLHPIRMEN